MYKVKSKQEVRLIRVGPVNEQQVRLIRAVQPITVEGQEQRQREAGSDISGKDSKIQQELQTGIHKTGSGESTTNANTEAPHQMHAGTVTVTISAWGRWCFLALLCGTRASQGHEHGCTMFLSLGTKIPSQSDGTAVLQRVSRSGTRLW